MSTETVETLPEEWVYLGVQLWGGKRAVVFETPEGETGYTRKVLPGYAKPGAIYRIHVTREEGKTSIVTRGINKPAYTGMIENDERRAQLEVASRACEIELRMEQKAKNDMEKSALRELLTPLREEYHRRNQVGRAALVATIIEELR